MSTGRKSRRVVQEGSFYRTTIKDWPESERPREKMFAHGAASLTESELLAILIRTGTKGATALDLAKNLLAHTKNLRELGQMNVSDLVALGIGRSRASAIVAAFELHRRLPDRDVEEKLIIQGPEDVVKRFSLKLRDLTHEEFRVLHLSSSNRLIRESVITKGILNSSLVHPRECFREAIKEKAASVIFLHNHPSGNAEPSQEDINITRQLVEAGKIIGIPVHDHIIIGGFDYTSFAEKGLLGG